MSVDAVEKALGEFELIGGAGSEADGKACAMTLLSWIHGSRWNPDAVVLDEDGSDSGERGAFEGGEWTDHPSCAARTIANNVISANDAESTTPEMREELVRAGRTGVLDTWWVPDEVIAVSLALREGESSDVYERTLRLLARVAEWKTSDSKERPVLSGAVLSGAVLRGAVLSGAVLSDAVLSGADLRDADLSGAVLSGAVLSGAVLRGAVLRGAVLSDADLSDADLRDADLRDAVLRDAVLSDADLSDADLRGAVLRGADLSGADLRGADLRDADLSGAVLRDAVLRGAVLRGADLRDAAGLPLTGAPAGWKLSSTGLWVKSDAKSKDA